jgi:hypothetical protein
MSESDACSGWEFEEDWAELADEAAWSRAILDGPAAPAVAERFHITDLQHWVDLCA